MQEPYLPSEKQIETLYGLHAVKQFPRYVECEVNSTSFVSLNEGQGKSQMVAICYRPVAERIGWPTISAPGNHNMSRLQTFAHAGFMFL
jgi:hypothetical protein